MWNRLALFLLICWLTFSCHRKVAVQSLQNAADVFAIASHGSLEKRDKMYCDDALAYAPYASEKAWTDHRKIRVNFHIMNDTIGDKNFPDTEETYIYFKKLLENANERLSNNRKMNLPVGNDTPNLKPKYSYVLTPNTQAKDDKGIYFHYDNDLYYFVNKGKNRNNYSKDVIRKYGKHVDSILNVFVLPHHPDSIASKTYGAFGTGIALGTSVKVAGLYDGKLKFWDYATLLNHEIGHVFGLNHAWTKSDGCNDTPSHPNCWGPNGKAPCDGEVVSNNVMDYNANQMAITPCQLGRVHRKIAKESSKKRGLVIPNWCDPVVDKTIIIDRHVEWSGAKDLRKDIVILPDASLTVSCRLSLARGRKIVVKKGGQLILNGGRIHNACGDRWGGILIEKNKEKPALIKNGEVILEDMPEA